MPFRRRRSVRRSGARGRAREWLQWGLENPAVPDSAPSASVGLPRNSVYAGYIISPDEMQAMYDEPTLVRTRVTMHCIIVSSVANIGHFLGVGLIKSNIEAPSGALPGALLPFVQLPYFDGDAEWIWTTHLHRSTATGFTGFEINVFPENGGESKTKRRFESGSGLMLVAYYTAEAVGASVMRFVIGGRLLFLNR